MTDNSALTALEDRTAQPSGQDYADWWSPHKDDPETLVGVVVEAHDSQFDEDSDVNPVFTIRSIGEPSDFDKGTERSTRTHVQLVRGLEQHGVQLGDLVNLHYTGLEATDNGNAANTYEVGVVAQDEWEDMEEAELLTEVLESNGGLKGDTRGDGDPDTFESGDDDDGQSALAESVPDGASESSGIDDEVLEFAQGTVDMQNGEMPLDKLDKMLNDVRDFAVDTEEVADALDYTIDDGVVTRN